VYKKPVVALMSTGNELVDLQGPEVQQSGDAFAGINDTNRPALRAVLEGLGYEVIDLGIVNDRYVIRPPSKYDKPPHSFIFQR
jgi:gephyrin